MYMWFLYIYIYIERERERERETKKYENLSNFVFFRSHIDHTCLTFI